MIQTQLDEFCKAHNDLDFSISNDRSLAKFVCRKTKTEIVIEMSDLKKMNVFDLYRAIYKVHLLDE